MTDEELAAHGVYVVAYAVKDKPYKAEYRGPGSWAVTDGVANLNRMGDWEYEPRPSGRETEFLLRCRFSREEALRKLIRL